MLNELAKHCHEAAVKKGFYEKEHAMIELLKDQPDEMRLYLKSILIDNRLMLIVTELSEAVESLRKFRFAQKQVFENRIKEDQLNYDQHFKHAYECHMKDTFETEIAGTMVRLLDLIGAEKIDIDYYLQRELEFNSMRDKMHGKQF